MKSSYIARNGRPRQRHFHTSDGVKATNRRKVALQTLENQLIKGTKTKKLVEIPLTESDIKRINSEISILKSKIS